MLHLFHFAIFRTELKRSNLITYKKMMMIIRQKYICFHIFVGRKYIFEMEIYDKSRDVYKLQFVRNNITFRQGYLDYIQIHEIV